jgi:hypothetical protein
VDAPMILLSIMTSMPTHSSLSACKDTPSVAFLGSASKSASAGEQGIEGNVLKSSRSTSAGPKKVVARKIALVCVSSFTVLHYILTSCVTLTLDKPVRVSSYVSQHDTRTDLLTSSHRTSTILKPVSSASPSSSNVASDAHLTVAPLQVVHAPLPASTPAVPGHLDHIYRPEVPACTPPVTTMASVAPWQPPPAPLPTCGSAVRNDLGGVQDQATSASVPRAARTAASIWSAPLQPAPSLPTSGLATHSDPVQVCVPAAPVYTPQGRTTVVLSDTTTNANSGKSVDTESKSVQPAEKIGPLLDTLEGGKTWYSNGSINPA